MTPLSPSGGVRFVGAVVRALSVTLRVVQRDDSNAADGVGMNWFCLGSVIVADTMFLCSLLLMVWSKVQAGGFSSDGRIGTVPNGIADASRQTIRNHSDRFHI